MNTRILLEQALDALLDVALWRADHAGVFATNKTHEVIAAIRAELAKPSAVPVPLSDAQIVNTMRDGFNCRYNDWGDHIDFTRAIERAHGIGEAKP